MPINKIRCERCRKIFLIKALFAPIDFKIPIVEVPQISDEEIYNLNFKKFELLGGQLFRAKIYKTDNEVVLFFDMHHIITDGASVNILFKSFSNAYEGKEIEKETIDGYINALIENENENSDEYIACERYFHDLLSQEVDSTVLTPNINGNPDDGKLKSISKNINPQIIRKFCADERISPNVLFMASTIPNMARMKKDTPSAIYMIGSPPLLSSKSFVCLMTCNSFYNLF